MDLEMDDHVRLVAEHMARNIPATKLVAVADAIGKIAPLIWDHYEREELRALRLSYRSMPLGEPRTQPSSIGLAGAGDERGDSAVEMACLSLTQPPIRTPHSDISPSLA
jgi:hypothetical protein